MYILFPSKLFLYHFYSLFLFIFILCGTLENFFCVKCAVELKLDWIGKSQLKKLLENVLQISYFSVHAAFMTSCVQ